MILLHGTGTHNKGAELMAIAVLQHFRALPNPPQFAVPPYFGPFPDRAKYGLWTLLSERRIGRAKLAAVLAHASFRQKYGLAAESDISAVIDASGFAFGDQHGPRPTLEMAAHCRRWKRQGKKIVLLPQAFGPFSSPAIRQACRELVDNCDLVFARDAESYAHLTGVVGKRETVKLAPDFTPLVQGELPPGYKPEANTVFVVPNMRMLDKTDLRTAQSYVPFLARVIEAINGRGLRAAVLLHTPEDRALGRSLQADCGDNFPVIEEGCPVRLKGVLGTAYGTVSSRFHALVGALSQNIPALAIGWSHKYGQLMADFGCPEARAEVGDLAAVDRWLDRITDRSEREKLVAAMARANSQIRGQIEQMWQEVDSVLGLSS